jgi:hypothetical protein
MKIPKRKETAKVDDYKKKKENAEVQNNELTARFTITSLTSAPKSCTTRHFVYIIQFCIYYTVLYYTSHHIYIAEGRHFTAKHTCW